MTHSNYRVLALLWLAVAALNAIYSQAFYANTMIEVGPPAGEIGVGQLIRVSPWASILSFFAVIMMLVYGRGKKLASNTLGWLHLVGTVAAILIAWNVVSLALNGGLVYASSEEVAREIAQQQIALIRWEFRAAAFLFVFSQLLFLINLLRKSGRGEDQFQDQLLDEV